MDAEKRKRQHTLPDRRLAQVFRFSAADLASNRSGFITKAQTWAIPLGFRWIFHQLGDWASTRNWSFSERQPADVVCGRAKLSYEQQQIQSIYHSDFIEIYKLSINQFEFRITAEQHQAIGDGVVYHLYYNAESKHILSLERAINGC